MMTKIRQFGAWLHRWASKKSVALASLSLLVLVWSYIGYDAYTEHRLEQQMKAYCQGYCSAHRVQVRNFQILPDGSFQCCCGRE